MILYIFHTFSVLPPQPFDANCPVVAREIGGFLRLYGVYVWKRAASPINPCLQRAMKYSRPPLTIVDALPSTAVSPNTIATDL